MKITTDIILAVEPTALILCGSRTFDYVDIVEYSTKPRIEEGKKVLWCITAASTDDDVSWYGVKFDRSELVGIKLATDKSIVILTDKRILGTLNQIVVPDVKQTLEKIHTFILGECKPEVIGVTGSVGKTTCVCMFEEVLAQYGKTLRIYSKRITPLNLFEMVINGVDHDTKYVVLEYAMYYRHHVSELVRMIKPTVGILLNIEVAHLGVDGIQTRDDIWQAKRAVIDSAKFGFVENDTRVLLGSSTKTFFWRETFGMRNGCEPFIKSQLQYAQMAAVVRTLRELRGEVTERDISVMCHFVPKEKRLMSVDVGKYRNVFFDGEVTNASRLKALSETFYDKKTLVIQALEFYDQDLGFQRDQFVKALTRFSAVYVDKVTHARFEFELFGDYPVRVYSSFAEIKRQGKMFIHWGAYWRQFEVLDNLRSAFA